MDHLNEDAQKVVLRENTIRKQFIRGYKWIGYSRAQGVLNQLDEIVIAPRTSRMPNILLVGSSNNGKTVIVEKFSKKYPVELNEEEQDVKRKVLVVEAPPLPDEKRFYQQILTELYVPFRSNHKPEILLNQVMTMFRILDLKVLVIDEIHHLLTGTGTKKQVFLNALKSISNKLGISIVAVGTKDAFHVFQSDPQMASRFETVPLSKWDLNKEYIRFLVTYEKNLPLKEKSNLFEKETAIKILSLTDHTIGGITTVLKKAALAAIDTREEKISLELINRLNLKHPDEVKKMPII